MSAAKPAFSSFPKVAFLVLLLFSFLVPQDLFARDAQKARDAPIIDSEDIFHPVAGTRGMVVSQHFIASEVGVEILRRGGNAVDAAVAVNLALAVVLPRAGNLGGGGFMVIYDAESGETHALDYRELAPAAAHRDMFLDADGNFDPKLSQRTRLGVGVPGTPAGLAAVLERFGTMPLEELIRPAIRLASEGFDVTVDFAEKLEVRRQLFSRESASREIFVKDDGSGWTPGETFVQKDLAWSLRQIAEHGVSAFYEGEIAERLVADMKANGGLITKEDLAAYRPTWREPVRGEYRGYQIVSMPPPSSGGVHLIQMLNILEAYPLGHLGAQSAETLHLMAEAMKYAYADRSKHLGDPDFWDVPVDSLISEEHAAAQRAKIDRFRSRPASEIAPARFARAESPDTTHLSIVDRHGNAVSCTTTLNFSFGTGIVAAGTGILLNNEMDDFSAKPGTPNGYGLIGGEANAVEARKRPLSSMTPTILLRDGKPYLITGSPGGSRIINTVLQIVLNVVDHEMNIAVATNASRIHHQWIPDRLRVEKGFSPDTLHLLSARGHRVSVEEAIGGTQSIIWDGERFLGASDPRRPDGAARGF